MRINPTQTIKDPAEWFTGDVFIDLIARGGGPSRIQVGAVRFIPGARSAWRSHGFGQTLSVTESVGKIQTRGGEIPEIRPGDIIYTMTENGLDKPDTWGDHVTAPMGVAASHRGDGSLPRAR